MRAAEPAGLQGRHHRVGALPARHAGEALRAFDRGGDLLPRIIVQGLLLVEEIHVREPAALEKAQHPLRRPREMRQSREPLGRRGAARRLAERARDTRRQQRPQGHAADTTRRPPDEGAPGEMLEIVVRRLHGQRIELIRK